MSNNLDIDQLAAAQNQKEVTINDANAQIDAALTDAVTVSVTSTDAYTLSDTEFRRYQFITVDEDGGDPATGAITLTVPAIARGVFTIINDTAFTVTVEVSGQSEASPTLVAGDRTGLTCDGSDVRAATSSLSVDHGGLSGLADDDHTQYLLIDGSRAMTGPILAAAGTEGAPSVSFTSDTNTGMYRFSTDKIGFSTGGGHAITIDDINRLIVSSNGVAKSCYLPGFATNYLPTLQVMGNSFSQSQLSCSNYSSSTSDSGCASVSINTSNNATEGSHTIAVDGQKVGAIGFGASDGVKFIGAATIEARIDGTPGVSDMPGEMIFRTTRDGESNPTRALTLRADHGTEISPDGYLKNASYSVAGAPSASSAGAGAQIYVTNGDAGSACMAVSDGTNWKVVSLGATIST